jgi:hypothetical protein
MSTTATWHELPADVRAFVETTLSPYPLQLEAWRLELCGKSVRAIATIQAVNRTTARDRLRAAHLRLHNAGLRQNAYGRYTIKENAA